MPSFAHRRANVSHGMRRAAKTKRRMHRKQKKYFPRIKKVKRPIPIVRQVTVQTIKPKPRVWRRVLLYTVRAGLLFLSLQASLHLANGVNDRYLQSSQFRSFFQEKYGARLSGWRKDIEENPSLMNAINFSLRQEWLESPFNLSSLRITPNEFYHKSIWEQLEVMTGRGNDFLGRARKSIFGLKMELIPSAEQHTVHHEIKHIRTYDVLRKYPHFREEWENLCRDKEGRLLFTDDWEKTVRSKDIELGFIGQSARKSLMEDVAEIGESVESFPESVATLIFDPSPQGRIFLAKVRLAQKYGIIPPETIQFLEFHRLDMFAMSELGRPEWKGKYKQRMKLAIYRAYQFLRKFPNSIYAPELYATICAGLNNPPEEKRLVKKILTYPHNQIMYGGALKQLMYLEYNDEEKRGILGRAIELYEERTNKGDVLLPIQGVNDFLQDNGIL